MSIDNHKFIITRKNHDIYYGYFCNETPLELSCEPEHSESLLGNIYVARVEKVAEEIGGAFLEISHGQKCYYPFPGNGLKPVKLSPGHEEKLFGGDLILVQITKDAVKNKLPVADSNISLTGKYFVLTLSDQRCGISKKITAPEERVRLCAMTDTYRDEPFGLIVRTNASGVPEAELKKELSQLKAQYESLMRKASIALGKTLLYQGAPYYISYPVDIVRDALTEIVTDQKDIYDRLMEYYQTLNDHEIIKKLRFYQDDYPLWKLYRMEFHYEKALGKTVWLSSGASLVIEPTEAMVVIDVNTGGVTKKKQKEEDLFYQINREAALEIGRQLRLRNLSGIIVIDFINMRQEKHQQKLLNYLREICGKDRIRTHVVDITALNLVEMTRQKVRRPLHEQWTLCHKM